jgi:hypothetical protein
MLITDTRKFSVEKVIETELVVGYWKKGKDDSAIITSIITKYWILPHIEYEKETITN